ncbi:MAG: hypothetical protein M3O61_18410, partial [Gemmatimonadota bacterium]|nr:hypothetical protein [Gemmatimonadota bacterium]
LTPISGPFSVFRTRMDIILGLEYGGFKYLVVGTILRTFFERKGVTKKATTCLNVSAQLHFK